MRPWFLLCVALADPGSHLIAQAAWTRRYPVHAPPYRVNAAMAFDAVRGRVRLFGGTPDSVIRFSDLWEWNGTDWELVADTGAPGLWGHGMAFDSVRGRMVVYGGEGATGTNDTWELVGSQWLRRSTAQQPPQRVEFGMTFDSVRGRVVLFGGRLPSSGSTALGDTWEWDGQNWVQRSTAPAPQARYRAPLVFDAIRGVSLLYGGVATGGTATLGDTWTWNGSAWQMQMPLNTPVPQVDHKMAFDLHRGRVVLQGDGYRNPFAWEWDGQNWSIVLATMPGVQQYHAMGYDANRRETVLYGTNRQVYANHGDTWIYRTDLPASFESYGQGCLGSAGVPVLGNEPFSLPWTGTTFRTQVTSLAPAVAAAIFITGLTSTPATSLAAYGMPGCDSFLVPISSELGLATSSAAHWSIVVPNIPGLAGMQLRQQAVVLDAVNPAGAVVSNAGTMTVGIR